MAIEFVCPACSGALQVGDETAGRVIRCGGCMTTLRVPGSEPAPTPAPVGPFEDAPPPTRRPTQQPFEVEPYPDGDGLPTAHRVNSRPRRTPIDSHGERPRRTRRTPPPKGNAVYIWILVAGGIGLFGLFACCAGILLMMPKPTWELHESEAGGFRVEMPGPVQDGVEAAAGLPLEVGAKSEGAALSVTEQCMVIYRDGPGTKDRAEMNETDEQEIDETLDKLMNRAGAGKPLRDQRMTVGGFPAREIEVRGAAGWYVARVVVADTRVYILLVHGLKKPAEDNVRRFIDSFEITDAKLAKSGRERAAAAVKAKDRVEKGKNDPKNRDEEEGRELRRAARAVTELAISIATED